MRQLSEGIQLLEVPHINLLVAFFVFVFDLHLFPKIVHWKIFRLMKSWYGLS